MKKFFCLTVVFFILAVNLLSAQNSGKSANRNTALRCLKLAENCLIAKDWENALKQANLGLSYDESISDLVYAKAVSESNLGKSKADILVLINKAFELNDWVGYSKNGARIILADLLCDTGMYNESLDVLDSDPLLYSADAEYIRVKNYYRMGTVQSVNTARLKLNSTRRIYPSDSRFPEIFFMFETLFLNEALKNNGTYEIPEIVKTVSSSYIAKLPDYSGSNPQMELMATFFADDKMSNRLVRAIDAKDQTIHPLLAIAGLKCGLYTEEQAVELFFNSFNDSISLDMLENLVFYIKSTEVQQKLIELLSDYSGNIYIDENLDLQHEILVQYKNGRPESITYDRNNDGVTDLYSTCDLGAPLYIHYNSNNSEIFYDGFPKVAKVSFLEENYTFKYVYDDFEYTPYNLVPDKYFEELGVDFYVPDFDGQLSIPDMQKIALNASNVELPVEERDGASVIFTINENNLVFANYIQDNKKYATCDFTEGQPYTRYVDYDNDGYFETTEIYDAIPETGFDKEKEKQLVQSIFTKLIDCDNLYLKKVLIDRNGNTNYEYSEQYIELNGKISLWDNDDNGIWDCQYVRCPQAEGDSLVEETIYYNDAGIQSLFISTVDGVPVKMISEDSEVMINAGTLDNFYWIEETGSYEYEEEISKKVNKGFVQGAVDIIQVQEQRISVIKINENIYCRLLPASEIIEENEAAE